MDEMNLEQQFLQLVKIAEQMQHRIMELERNDSVLVSGNRELIQWVKQVESDIYLLQENMRYEVLDGRNSYETLWYPKIADREKTISLIINEGKSISRFGDGEFATIEGKVRHKFQSEVDPKLGGRLREVLSSENDNLMVAIADNYGTLAHYTTPVQREIRAYMTPAVRAFHEQCLSKDREYHNTYLTRPYSVYRDQNTDAPRVRFEQLKQIWNGKDCVFVEGEKTRMGVGNDLFAGAKSIRRILGPAENAFRAYDEILAECKKIPKDCLFIIAMGPTASVLAHDLCEAGYQALDMGHMDLEYEWFLRGQGGRTPVPTKYNNECENGENVLEINDVNYEKQIIARIV